MYEPLAHWAQAHPWPAALVVVAAAVLAIGMTWGAGRVLRRLNCPGTPVVVAALAAMACTAYSADTSWAFAERHLGMKTTDERLTFFFVAEFVLIACGVIAHANKKATATETDAGSPGAPGALMWLLTGVQIIPAFAVSGLVGGTVRAIIGPVMAGVLWHEAMGLEIRIRRPQSVAYGLLPVIGRELRKRLLSRLGLGERNRTAQELTQDRAADRAARLARRRWLGPWGKVRLGAAVVLSGAATNPARRHRLMQFVAARRTALELRSVPIQSCWEYQEVQESYPSTALGVAGAQLRAMDPFDAVCQVHRARPDADEATVAYLLTEHGVPVSAQQVRLVLRNESRAGGVPVREPIIEPQHSPRVQGAPSGTGDGIPGAANGSTADGGRLADSPEVSTVPVRPSTAGVLICGPRLFPVPAVPASPDEAGTQSLTNRAKEVQAEYHRQTRTSRPVPIRTLKRKLHIGQDKAAELQAQLALNGIDS